MLPPLLVWLHLIAAISWIGGMVFLSLILAPLLRSQKATPELMELFRTAARRFRIVVWAAIVLLVATGPLLLHQRGLSLAEPASWPLVLEIKIGLVGLLFLLTFLHDLVLGPRVSRISLVPAGTRTPGQQALMRTSRWLPRLALLLALVVLWAAVLLVRS
jgi:copper resistance protein D